MVDMKNPILFRTIFYICEDFSCPHQCSLCLCFIPFLQGSENSSDSSESLSGTGALLSHFTEWFIYMPGVFLSQRLHETVPKLSCLPLCSDHWTTLPPCGRKTFLDNESDLSRVLVPYLNVILLESLSTCLSFAFLNYWSRSSRCHGVKLNIFKPSDAKRGRLPWAEQQAPVILFWHKTIRFLFSSFRFYWIAMCIRV